MAHAAQQTNLGTGMRATIQETETSTKPHFLFIIMLNHHVALASRSRSNPQKLKTTTRALNILD
jgi:hypothetical protein